MAIHNDQKPTAIRPKRRGSASRGERFSEHKTYKFILQWLRYAFAKRVRFIRVVEIRPRTNPSTSGKASSDQIVVEIPPLPRRSPISVKSVARFLQSDRIQEEVLKWIGEQLAEKMPATAPSMRKLRKAFLRLEVGRARQIPPDTVLQGQYRTLILELQALRLTVPGITGPLTNKIQNHVLAIGKEKTTSWYPFVKQNRISLGELLKESPRSAAKLVLAKQYGCTEEAIHAHLFRSR